MHYSVSDIKIMAENIADSKMFRYSTKDFKNKPLSVSQIMTLMLISNAEGRHPALGPKDYDLIDGRPAKKTEAMLRDFLQAGGSVTWERLNDAGASATFSHPQGGMVKIDWDMARANKAGLAGKDMWKKWGRPMFRSRTISEGLRTVYPAACSGVYNTEEMQDITGDLSLSVTESQLEPLDPLCERLAADVAVSNDLAATYLAHADLMARIEIERPEYMELIQDLFEIRGKELENTAQAV